MPQTLSVHYAGTRYMVDVNESMTVDSFLYNEKYQAMIGFPQVNSELIDFDTNTVLLNDDYIDEYTELFIRTKANTKA